MKLIFLLSIVALVACDYPPAEPEAPSDSYGAPTQEPVENVTPSLVPIDNNKSFFNFKNVYYGAFPPATLPPVNFLSQSSFPTYKYPLKPFNLAAPPQGILPPISQIIPPQISQIVPPNTIGGIIPPVFGGSKPILPINPNPAFPSQTFPPVTTPFSFGSINNFAFPSYTPSLYQYPFRYPYSFPSNFFSQIPKKQSKPQSETLSTSYGPPASTPVESSAPFEPAGQAESSAPFEPSPVSFPYEPAAPESPESSQQKPAQEYGLPSK